MLAAETRAVHLGQDAAAVQREHMQQYLWSCMWLQLEHCRLWHSPLCACSRSARGHQGLNVLPLWMCNTCKIDMGVWRYLVGGVVHRCHCRAGMLHVGRSLLGV